MPDTVSFAPLATCRVKRRRPGFAPSPTVSALSTVSAARLRTCTAVADVASEIVVAASTVSSPAASSAARVKPLSADSAAKATFVASDAMKTGLGESAASAWPVTLTAPAPLSSKAPPASNARDDAVSVAPGATFARATPPVTDRASSATVAAGARAAPPASVTGVASSASRAPLVARVPSSMRTAEKFERGVASVKRPLPVLCSVPPSPFSASVTFAPVGPVEERNGSAPTSVMALP